MTRPLSQTQPTFDLRLKELARNVGDLRREVRALPTGGGGGSAAWGGITGTLSAQTDLQTALNGKQAAGSYQPLATVLTNTTASFTTALETKLNGIATGATANLGTVTSVGGTGTVSGLTLTGTVTSSGNLTLGGTLSVTPSNFASQTQNTFLAAPNGSAGVPTFRAIVAADIPTLNQSTTGSAATLTTGRTIGMTGDVTWASASFNGSGNVTGTSTIGNNVVSNAKLATVATGTIKGRVTAAAGNVEDLTGTQATTLLDTFTSALKGLAPASGGGTTNFLRADGTWAAPAGGGGGGGLGGVATITLPIQRGQYEHEETVAAVGVTASNRIILGLAPCADDEENCPEMLDIQTFAAVPGTDTITITAAFSQLCSGPVKFNWSAL